MATLPLLKSGHAVQYPLKRSCEVGVDTIAFLDGSEQRCALTRPLREWTIQLGLIDEQELQSLESFVREQQGKVGRFQFTDPATGAQYNDCSLALDILSERFDAPGRVGAALVIRENPK